MKACQTIFVAAAVTLFAQPALLTAQENLEEAYNRVEDLSEQIQSAIDAGEYQRAIDLSEETDGIIDQIAGIEEERARQLAAEAEAAEEAQQLAAEEPEPIGETERADEPEEEPATVEEEPTVVEEPAGIDEEPAVAATDDADADGDTVELPAYYIVQLRPRRRDTLARIASFDFVYGDAHEWRRLYEANRDILPNPDNPNLILPGMQLTIPEREGEQRAGVR